MLYEFKQISWLDIFCYLRVTEITVFVVTVVIVILVVLVLSLCIYIYKAKKTCMHSALNYKYRSTSPPLQKILRAPMVVLAIYTHGI